MKNGSIKLASFLLFLSIFMTTPLIARPRPILAFEKFYKTEHFLIHYSERGLDTVTLNQVKSFAIVAESVWQREVAEMGYPAPGSDGDYGAVKVDGKWQYGAYYDIYLSNYILDFVAGPWAGITTCSEQTEYCYPFTIVHAKYVRGGDQLSAPIFAHEFFHAIQYTLDYRDEKWWYESTATWMGATVYDNSNDWYSLILDGFKQPDSAMTSLPYASVLWAFALSERFGAEIIKDISLAAYADDTATALATNQLMVESPEYGGLASWSAIFHAYRESLFDLARYEEGAGYLQYIQSQNIPEVQKITSYAFPTATFNRLGGVSATAANFIELKAPAQTVGTLTIQLTDQAGYLMASVLGDAGSSTIDTKGTADSADDTVFPKTELAQAVRPGTGLNITIPNFGSPELRRVVVVISNPEINADHSGSYQLNATLTHE